MGRRSGVEVIVERPKTPADGTSAVKVLVRYADPPPAPLTFKLKRRGSLSADETLRQQEYELNNGEVELTVFAPRRPGIAVLTGPGFRQRLDFAATSIWQSILFDWAPTLIVAFGLAILLKTFVVANFYIPSGSMEPTLFKNDFLIANKLSYKLLRQDPKRGEIMIFQYPEDRGVDYIKRIIGLPGDTIRVTGGEVYVNGQPLNEDYIQEAPRSPFTETQVPSAGPPEFYYTSEMFELGGKGFSDLSDSAIFTTLNLKTYDAELKLAASPGDSGSNLAGTLQLTGNPDYCFPLEIGVFAAGSDTPIATRPLSLLPGQETLRLSRWEFEFIFRDIAAGEYALRLYMTPRDCFFAMGDNRNNSQDSRVWGFVPREFMEGRAMFVYWPFRHAQVLNRDASVFTEAAVAADGD